ncbi:hypothetical protein [Sulfurimonas sp.]|jgi:hypothetical protein|uniref:hypothetical protein n=1 Tax=Sulfurimonas sp. TaxID=2022749 RepID=UPI0025E0AC13|nr:hypothetical protein [Sulfurimonas sp.]MBT5933736.1 hypothetical protein [Sulfurimonas sp.]
MSDKLITEEFLDTYEGDVMFLSQDLENIRKDILNCNFSEEKKNFLSDNITEVHDVFLSSRYTQQVAPTFMEFTDLLSTINTDELVKNKDTMSYLYDIVSDINVYINQYFISRIFSDVYLFQDSLYNSINFLKSAYLLDVDSTDADDGSEVLFFND